MADSILTPVSAEVINADLTALEDLVNSKADLNGDSTEKFNVADATESTEAINKGQFDTSIAAINADISGLETGLAAKANKNGDSAQTFNVANATTSTQAVNKGQLDNYMPNRSTIASQAMPSNTYIDVTLASTASNFTAGSTFTAPANGYFCIASTASNTNAFIYMANGFVRTEGFGNTQVAINVYLPCKAGQSIFYNWYHLTDNDMHGYFTYAEGEV